MLISDFFYNSYLLNYKYFEEKHFILKITLKKFFLEKSYFLISPKLSIFRHKDVILSFRLISPKLSICEGKSHCFRGHFGKIPDSITLIWLQTSDGARVEFLQWVDIYIWNLSTKKVEYLKLNNNFGQNIIYMRLHSPW